MHHTNRYSQIVLAFVLLGGIFGHATAASAQAATLHDAAAQLTKELNDDPDVQKITGEHIVIAPFENINGKGDAVPRILQEMFTTDFIKAKHFKVLERDQLQSALDELHFQLSDLADPAKAKKIGKLAGATYVLLGSISDTGSSTSINARIVSIETGESVAAEDEDIKTGDAPLAASGLNPALATPTPATTALIDNTPAIDLNANAVPTTAGQFTGKKDNFGLLGGTGFKIAWREDLGKDFIFSFAAGDVLGDGGSRLVLGKMLNDFIQLSVQKWSDKTFVQTWISESAPSDYPVYNFDGSSYYTRVLPQEKAPSRIFICGSSNTKSWLWDGANYVRQDLLYLGITDILTSLPKTLVGESYGVGTIDHADGLIKSVVNDSNNSNLGLVFYKGFRTFSSSSDIVAADFDGDGNIELALAQAANINLSGKPIEIYSLAGIRKAVTTRGYGGRLAVWNPAASKFPYIVARKNTSNEQGENNGGYVYFIQWNGESYDEVWHSNKIGDAVIDMQVCDPKSEGKTGLVILSKQDKNYFLTKIVLAN